MVKNPVASEDQLGQPVVLLEVKEAWQARFGDWTEKNRMLPLAIVLDGEYHLAPTIRARLTTYVQITLGRGSPADLARKAKALATVLQTGALKLRPTLVSVEER